MSGTHEELLRIVKKLPSDFQPYGKRNRDTDEPWQDCSCGCRHFLELAGPLGFDWGVCANPASPRCGLLTFEHQGCPKFEAEPEPVPESESTEAGIDGEEEERPALKKLKVDLGEFTMALEGGYGDQGSFYLDKETGNVIVLFEDFDEEGEGELREEIEDDELGRYISIDRLDSHEAFRIMERFALSLPPSAIKERLLDALSRNKPFRRFKDALLHDSAVRESWFAFHEAELATFARDMLEANGIEPEWTGPAETRGAE